MVVGMLCNMYAIILKNKLYKKSDKVPYGTSKPLASYKNVIKYIRSSYSENLSLEDMARAYRRGKNKGAKVKEKELNAYYQNELDEVYKNYADRLKDVLKENEKLKIKVAYRHEVQTMLEKRIAELEKENAELKEKLKPENCLKLLAKEGYIKFTSEQLTKAKEIIKNLLFLHNDKFGSTRLEWRCNVVAEAEQFLNEVEK
jgi:predicted RNA-binding protein with RPS1 domain